MNLEVFHDLDKLSRFNLSEFFFYARTNWMILSKEKKKRVIVLFFEYMKEARDSVEYSV